VSFLEEVEGGEKALLERAYDGTRGTCRRRSFKKSEGGLQLKVEMLDGMNDK
jgi:hypothetical protein